jgi:1,6-anhydro-N-acetylmuramate kinase
MMNCAYRVSGAGTLSLKLFGATLESPYTTTIAQMVKEGYKCQSIDEAVGFPASNCGLTAGSMTINSIVFTTTNGVYAAILTDVAAVGAGSPLMPMYSMAKLVNSNASAH